MANLKTVNTKRLIYNMNKINIDFKNIKDLIKKELEVGQGNISYQRIEEYDDLILELKKVTSIQKALMNDEKLVKLDGKELTTFCNKLKLDEDIFFKYKVLIQRIGDFDLNKYIKVIQKEIQTNLIQEQNEQIENLENLAYKDKLTGLYNRAKYEEDISSITNKNSFAVIFIDLNDLKKTNDSLGHDKGDELIQVFTNSLNKARTGLEEIYRIGGDEFIVLFKNAMETSVNKFIDSFNALLTIHNTSNELQVSVAYGITMAASEDKYLSINDLVKLADERMYEMKVRMKKQRV